MKKILDSFFSEKEQKKLGEFSRKAKKELSSLPLISAVGDATQGAAGLGDLKKNINQDPENPIYWLHFYEAHTMYKKMNAGVNVGRAMINPLAFVAGKGVSTGLNTLDEEHEQFQPTKCLGMTIMLTMRRLKRSSSLPQVEDLVLLAKALGYSSEFSSTNRKKFKMLNRAINYMSRAIELEKEKHLQAEFFFYIAQFYNQALNERMYLRALNISRKMGFYPAHKLLTEILKGKASNDEEKMRIKGTGANTSYQTFYYTYQPNMDEKFEKSWEHVKEQQAQKFSNTIDRIKKHF